MGFFCIIRNLNHLAATIKGSTSSPSNALNTFDISPSPRVNATAEQLIGHATRLTPTREARSTALGITATGQGCIAALGSRWLPALADAKLKARKPHRKALVKLLTRFTNHLSQAFQVSAF